MEIDLPSTTDKMAEAIYEADRNNWFAGCDYADLHEDDKSRLRAMAVAAFGILNCAQP